MAAPSREEALTTLADGHARLERLFARLAEDQTTRPATIGGGDWSAKDLLGHIALCEEIALVTMEAWLKGQRPPIEERFTVRETDAQNAWNQERKRDWPLDRVRTDSEATHRRLISAIEEMTDDDWEAPKTFEGDAREDLRTELGVVLGAPQRPFGHAFAHLSDLEAYVEQVTS
jgi:hypothetical protein